MFGAFVTQVLIVELAEEHTRRLGQASPEHLIRIGPASGAVGGDPASLACTPDRHTNGHHQRQQATASSDTAADIKYVRCVGIEDEPPLE
ncbi:hypothetical protein FQZ97_1030840 [compost metagenome]